MNPKLTRAKILKKMKQENLFFKNMFKKHKELTELVKLLNKLIKDYNYECPKIAVRINNNLNVTDLNITIKLP